MSFDRGLFAGNLENRDLGEYGSYICIYLAVTWNVSVYVHESG